MKTSTKISDLPESQRPYERFQEKGASSLSDQEILAIILGSGSRHKNALMLASEVLSKFARNQGISELTDTSIEELIQIDGIGYSKAIKIKASIELGRRTNLPQKISKQLFNAPDKIASYYMYRLSNLPREELHVAFLNKKNLLIKELQLSKGGLSSTVINPRDVFREAIRANASAFILIHNHPSGDPKPSQDDIDTTIKFKEAGEYLGIVLHDHIIIGKGEYYSMFSDYKLATLLKNT